MKLKFPKRRLLKLVSSVFLCLTLIFNQSSGFLILAQEVTETTPTPTVEQQQAEVTPNPTPSPTPTETPSPTPEPTSTTTTGDAYATAETVTETNVTQLGSDIQVNTQDVLGGESDINLLTLPDQNTTSSGTIEINNQANVEASTSATADTGNNLQEANSTYLQTGDAFASAQTTSLTNVNLLDSILGIGVVNIFSAWNGQIVLPSLPSLAALINATSAAVGIDNQATIVATTSSSANTGGNTQTGDNNSLNTGDSYSVSTTKVITNQTLYNAFLFELLVTNQQLWTGQVRNFLAPGSIQSAAEFLNSLLPVASSSAQCNSCNTSLGINNSATVGLTTIASANTGNNTQIGQSNTMTTGNAFAAANTTSVTNLSLINSIYIWGQVNLFQEWSGDLVFAYPDLKVTISAPSPVTSDDTFTYTSSITNLGYAPATNINLNTQLKDGDTPLASTPQEITTLNPGETVSFNYQFDADGYANHTLSIDTTATTPDAEESTANNYASTSVQVNDPPSPPITVSSTAPNHQPQLLLTVANNLHQFVYPGDTVRYNASVKNLGPGSAHDLILNQRLYSPQGKLIKRLNLPLSDIAANKKLKIDFNLNLPKTGVGNYTIVTQLDFQSESGEDFSTDTITNLIPVKQHPLVSSTILPHDPHSSISLNPQISSKILGASDSQNPLKKLLSSYYSLGFLPFSVFLLIKRQPHSTKLRYLLLLFTLFGTALLIGFQVTTYASAAGLL